jgi:hypothetical protein
MAKFYDQENDEDGSYEPQHIAAYNATGKHTDLGHGSTCDSCNDAKIISIRKGLGRISAFKLGHLEQKLHDGKAFGGRE